MKITKEQIFAAADALVAEGKTPKVSAVREVLGAGSFTTINEAMREWREAQKPAAAAPKEELPEAIANRLTVLGNEVWAGAVKAANESLEADRAELAAAKVEMDEQQRETAEYADKLAEEVDGLREKVERLEFAIANEKAAHSDTRDLLRTESDELTKLRAQHEATVGRLGEMTEERARLEGKIDDLTAARDKAKDQRTEAEHEIARLQALVQSLEQKADTLRESVQAHKEERDKAVTEAEAAKIEAAKMQGEVGALTKQLAQQAELFKQLTAPATNKTAPAKKKAETNG